MKIYDILSIEKIKIVPESDNKTEIINELIDLFINDSRINNIDLMRTAVIDRENIMSTGVGQGFAIPHAKTDGVNEMIAGFCKLTKPINFDSVDGEPVNLIFLMVGKEAAVGPHIKMLSRISRMMSKNEFRDSLAQADSAEEILDIFKTEEKNLLEIS